MTDQQIQENQLYFEQLCREYIQRDGLERLLHYLSHNTDFYTAPSSTSFHLNERGGLCQHSLNVFETALRLYRAVVQPAIKEGRANRQEEISDESIAICALLHDVCKCNIYHEVEKWRKDEHGRWQSYLGYEIVDEFPFGHGEKSCILINHYLRLTRDELLAIRWHMGAFEMTENGSAGRKSFYTACQSSHLVPLIQAADFLTAQCLETTTQH